jgi:hypothetical protein
MANAETVPNAQAEPENESESIEQAEEQGEQGSDQERGRSTIQFPYLDLSEAVAIAVGVHTEGGNSCRVDQLAARLSQEATAPKFRQKLGTSKMFGLITYGAGTVALTPLGVRINDQHQQAAAKAEAFLLVPLYRQVYDQFQGRNLPPNSGLENAMVTLGVAPKQKGNARQVFFRSATQAGFFTHGTNRLVTPSIKGGSAPVPSVEILPPSDVLKPPGGHAGKNGSGGDDGGDGKRHKLIDGLIQKLPEAETEWPLEARKKWLQAAINIFDLIYAAPDDGRSIKIDVQKESA